MGMDASWPICFDQSRIHHSQVRTRWCSSGRSRASTSCSRGWWSRPPSGCAGTWRSTNPRAAQVLQGGFGIQWAQGAWPHELRTCPPGLGPVRGVWSSPGRQISREAWRILKLNGETCSLGIAMTPPPPATDHSIAIIMQAFPEIEAPQNLWLTYQNRLLCTAFGRRYFGKCRCHP